MFNVPTISTIVAAVSILIGIIFTILELRHFNRTRKTEIIMRIYDRFSSKEMVQAMNKVGAAKFENITDYANKYGFTEIVELTVLFEALGVLLEQKLIDINLVDHLFGPTLNSLWGRMRPVLYAMRESLNEPFFFSHFEYLVKRLDSYRKRTQ